MYTSQRICRSSFVRVTSTLLLMLAWIVLDKNGAFGQRVPSPEQPQQSHKLNLRFADEQPRPLAMVSGDFDEDGVDDLVIGYGLEKGGSIALLRGNLDAIAPQTQASWLAAGRHEYSDPFLQQSRPIRLKSEPSLMVSADVNGDGHLDLVYASQGSSQLNVMLGDGKGNFLPPFSTQVPGGVTALAAYRPGAPLTGQAIVVGYQSNRSAGLSILTCDRSALHIRAAYALPGVPTAMTVANLDADYIPDIAIVAGGKLLVLHGKNAISGGGQLETLPVDRAESVAAGEFLFDRHAQLQLSVLTTYGDVVILAHEGFNPQPYTSQELAETRRQQSGRTNMPTLAQQAGNNGNEPWVEVETHYGMGARTLGDNAPILLRSRTSGNGGDDLVVINSAQQQRMLISHHITFSPDTPASPTARVTSSSLAPGDAIAALSLRVSPDGRSGLVVLHRNDPSPEFVVPSAGNTFYVNTTADNTGTTTDPDDGTRCTLGSGERCTLRDAVTFANNDATDNINSGRSDTIIVPAGTYTLTFQAGTIDANGNALTHLEIFGPVTISGASASTTIINAKSNDEVFTINPGVVGSYNGGANPVVFDALLENLTLQDGKNLNNPANSTNNFGGCINWDADGTGNLTIMNSVIQACSAFWGPGGGIWAFNSAGGGTGTLTLSGDSILNNSTPEEGGAVDVAFAPAALSATNTMFSGNEADSTVNSGDLDKFGEGGGLDFSERSPPPSTPQSTLTNVTISSNTAAEVDGGGIYTNAGISLGGSLISNNSAGRWGGGVFAEEASPEVGTTITNTNILNNSAAASGGGIFVGPDNPTGIDSLTISLSRIVGNISTGTTGLGTGSPGAAVATNNWWGCNAGPGNTGCDGAGIGATTSPYAQFILSATPPTTITLGSSISLSITLNTNSSSQSISPFPAVETNYPYTFSVSGVTATLPSSGTFNATGSGTATLTPTSTGSGTVSAKFDNQTESLNFTVNAAVPASVTINNGGGIQSATILTGFATPLSVTVKDAASAPIPNYTVAFTASPGSNGQSGAFSNSAGTIMVTTGSSGVANAGIFTANSIAGSYTVTATAGSVSATFILTNTPGVPANIALTSGSGQSAAIHTAFTNPLIATVTDAGGNLLSGVAVTFTAPTGLTSSLAFSNASTTISTTTNTLGQASSGPMTANGIPGGPYNVQASVGSVLNNFQLTNLGRSQTTIASLTSTSAAINVFGFGFTAPSGQLAFTDVTSSTPVAAPVTLNTATAMTSLLPQATTSTGANTLPVWTTLADLNGDGKPDLVTSLYLTDSVSVRLGNGDGTFQAASNILIASGFGPAENHLVSLRGDGTLDLIVASFNTNQIAILLGNGDGTFGPPQFYTVGSATNTPTSLTTGDFNHDGNLDVAVANTGDDTVSILLGNGSGALTPLGAPIPVGHDPEAIRAGDLNSDGYSDLVVANYLDGTVTALLNNQNGTFTASTISVGSGADSGPQALAINGSGASLLLAVANYSDDTVSVMHSNGSGGFGAQTIISVGKGPDDVNFADLNGDGIPDLAVANYSGSVSLVLGSSGGTYTTLGPFSVGDSPYSAAVGDLDQDGTPDIVVSNCFSNNIGVLLDGTQISVPYSGLSLTAGHRLNAAYTPDGASKYGSSTSPNVTAP